MACTCGANLFDHVGAAKCGPIHCTQCGKIYSPEEVRAYRKAKAAEAAAVEPEPIPEPETKPDEPEEAKAKRGK
jgi:hypothetical protein